MPSGPRDVQDWLVDVVEWGDKLAGYVSGIDEFAFLADEMRKDAVGRCLECIGEASRKIIASGEFAVSDLDFVQAYWTRNRLAHGYFDVNMSRVWATATVSAPILVDGVKALLASRPK